MEHELRDSSAPMLTEEEEARKLRKAPSREEIARREEILKAILHFRAEAPPLMVPAADLVRQGRKASEEKYG